MITGIWLPALVVLAVGVAVGVVAALRMRRSSAGAPDNHNLSLDVRDLERRRDELYDRLRSSDLDDADRLALELSAARTLQRLDTLGGRPASVGGEGTDVNLAAESTLPQSRDTGTAGLSPSSQDAAEQQEELAPFGFLARHPQLKGFLFGASAVTVIALLMFFAARDSGMTATPHPGAGAVENLDVSPELAAQMEEARSQLAANPQDLGARKRLALMLLSVGNLVEAFEEADRLLAVDSEDLDGLYVQGVVRLNMGQDDLALDLLDRVLLQYPQHVRALTAKGIILLRNGDPQGATAVWQQGLAMLGGSNPYIEELLRGALQTSEAQAAAPPTASPASAGAAAGGRAYEIDIELAAGVNASPGATLFLSLRDGPGPPIAVKRIDRPTFPLRVVLGPDDTMLGRELVDRGTLSARLDADGSVSTIAPTDLTAESAATAGTRTRLVLGSPE